MLKSLFKELGLGEHTQSVYEMLLQYGASSARHIGEIIGMPRPSVYDHLKILKHIGLVIERDEDNKTIFAVDAIQNISTLLEEKIKKLEDEKKKMTSLLPLFANTPGAFIPKIKFFSGIEGVRNVLDDFGRQKNLETKALWPIKEMIHLLGKEYFAELNRRRIRNNVFVQTIWPQNNLVDVKQNPFMGTGEAFLREVRVAPKGALWDMGFWIYGDKVAFISSKKEAFGFIVQSKDFAGLMGAQFEFIWKASKPKKPEPKYSADFLKTI